MHTERFLVDEEGRRLGVVLDIAEYKEILEDLEELASIRAYDAAKASDDEAIPFEQALQEIQRSRR
ncbi:MAG: hypothetical protein DMF53_20830 [Acidobacteria bacterium]|nr:MAG: hypothetical protein DMF53_20830 [Acidobacteriota bacterium]